MENENELIGAIILAATIYRGSVDKRFALFGIPDGERLVLNVRNIYINLVLDALRRLQEYANNN